MPTFRRSKRATRKPYRRRYRRWGIARPVTNNTAADNRQIVKMRYILNDGVTKTLSSVNGAITGNVYAANGVFQCDITGGAGQPFNFDQIMPMYRNFCVLSSKLKFWLACNKQTDALYSCGVVIALKDGSTQNTTVEELMGEPRCKYALWAPNESNRSHKGFFKLKSQVGIRDPMDNDNLWGTIAANPTEMWYYHINIWGWPTDVTQALNLHGFIDYKVELHHPMRPAAS